MIFTDFELVSDVKEEKVVDVLVDSEPIQKQGRLLEQFALAASFPERYDFDVLL